MGFEFRHTRRVEFSETDAAGIMHFSNFFRFMESAEHAFVRSLGLTIFEHGLTPPIGWPRVNAECEYLRPFKFEDEVEIHLQVARKSEKAIHYRFTFRKLGAAEISAIGQLSVVCVAYRDGRMQATFLPAAFNEKIEADPSLVGEEFADPRARRRAKK